MDYSQEELELMHEQGLLESGDGFVSGNPESFRSVSLDDLAEDENRSAFEVFKHYIDNKSILRIEFGVKNDIAFYKIIRQTIPYILYLNKSLINYIYSWLGKKEIAQAPTNFTPDEGMGEAYRWHLLKFDNKVGKIEHNAQTGEYTAILPKGSVNYGKLPYTPDELKSKLDSI